MYCQPLLQTVDDKYNMQSCSACQFQILERLLHQNHQKLLVCSCEIVFAHLMMMTEGSSCQISGEHLHGAGDVGIRTGWKGLSFRTGQVDRTSQVQPKYHVVCRLLILSSNAINSQSMLKIRRRLSFNLPPTYQGFVWRLVMHKNAKLQHQQLQTGVMRE